jgi:polar amino acid transport system substrate-binding protein
MRTAGAIIGMLCRIAIVLVITLAGSGAPAKPRIACGAVYTVQLGDTLHRIAVRAYGIGNYRTVFRANRDLLPNAASIEIGDRLLIPCLDGTGPRTRTEAKALGLLPATDGAGPKAGAAPAPLASAASVVADAPGIRLLTGSGFAPFADERLSEGGMITELVKLSLASAAPAHSVGLSYVNDWSQHLRLLESGAFDLGFPWYKPDCALADRLTTAMRARCSGFIFSAPLFEVAMGFYVRAGDPLRGATRPEQLIGTRICRPAGYFTFDLDQAGLREPKVTRVVLPTAADCLDLLADGMVDVVSLGETPAAREILRLGLDGQVVDIPALAAAQTLHAIAPETSAEGQAYIHLINAGLDKLRTSGRWYEVVAFHLGTFGLRVQ